MDLTMGNLYDVNKNIMAEYGHELTHMELPQKQEMLKDWFNKNVNNYAMMLCHDRRDYTVFHLGPINTCYATAAKEVIDCCKNRGAIYSIDLTDNKDAIEIWIKIENKFTKKKNSKEENPGEDFYCFYLFPYDEAVIECD